MKHKNFLTAMVVSIIAVFLFASCEKDELINEDQPQQTEVIKCAGCPKNIIRQAGGLK